MAREKGLTKRQKQIIECMIANPRLSDGKICELCGVTPTYISKLRLKPLFNEEYERRLKEVWNNATKMAVKNMIEIANKGVGHTAFEANKYILDSAGYAAPTEIKLDNNIIKVTIDEDN